MTQATAGGFTCEIQSGTVGQEGEPQPHQCQRIESGPHVRHQRYRHRGLKTDGKPLDRSTSDEGEDRIGRVGRGGVGVQGDPFGRGCGNQNTGH